MIELLIFAFFLSVICFASYAWGNVRLFQHRLQRPVQMKFINGMGVLFFGAQLLSIFLGRPIALLAAFGFALYIVAFCLFWWAVPYARAAKLNVAFTPTQPTELLTRGPYRYIRHPFYASYFCYWIAGVVISRQPWLLLSVVCMGSFYIFAILREEQEFKQVPLADLYIAYALVTGCLFPRLLRRNIWARRAKVGIH